MRSDFSELMSFSVEFPIKLIKLSVLLIPVISALKRKDFWRCLYFKPKNESNGGILSTVRNW